MPPLRRPRLGLCCTFATAPIKFRTTTARYLSTLAPADRRQFLGQLILHNAHALDQALAFCGGHGIGAFRIGSQFFPVYTHPAVGYRWAELPAAPAIARVLQSARKHAQDSDIRLSFHPDQFVVPGSANPAVVRASLAELEYQAEVAELVGAEQLTLHGGGAQGGKELSLGRLRRALDRLSPRARRLVVLENDDRVFSPRDLLPLCRTAGIRFVYDVHHHRCLPDELSIQEATAQATDTWAGGEPWFHVSSPAQGWQGRDPRPHHDRVWLRDLPATWRTMRGTIDVEAKAKEGAVLALLHALEKVRRGPEPTPASARPPRTAAKRRTAGGRRPATARAPRGPAR
jgi:UV DNA damage endonuclease